MGASGRFGLAAESNSRRTAQQAELMSRNSIILVGSLNPPAVPVSDCSIETGLLRSRLRDRYSNFYPAYLMRLAEPHDSRSAQ